VNIDTRTRKNIKFVLLVAAVAVVVVVNVVVVAVVINSMYNLFTG